MNGAARRSRPADANGALATRTGTLWFAVLGGPVAWTIHLLGSYPLVRVACDLGTSLPLNLLTAATALLSIAAAAAGFRAWRRLTGTEPAPTPTGSPTRTAAAGNPPGRARFMAVVGAILGAFFTYVILIEGLPPLLQDPCSRGL